MKGKIISITLLMMATLLLLVSISPLYQILREINIDSKIKSQYAIEHAYVDDSGFPNIIDVNKITIEGMEFEIFEEATGKKAPRTRHDIDEGVPPGDIVNIRVLLNGKSISEASEIWLSNRNRGSKFFSWLDMVTVKDFKSGETYVALVQRLTDDEDLDNREWKVIYITTDGEITEEKISYERRSEHPLAVKLINFTDTSLIALGYHSDILQGYPSLLFPIIYPFFTALLGLIGVLVCMISLLKKRS